MGKVIYFVVGFLLVSIIISEVVGSGECPQRSQVHSCSPTCYTNSDCSYGKLCCENNCNSKSCSEGVTSGSSGYKGSSTGGSGIYCNNVKCRSGEKCALDRVTNRQKCVRQ